MHVLVDVVLVLYPPYPDVLEFDPYLFSFRTGTLLITFFQRLATLRVSHLGSLSVKLWHSELIMNAREQIVRVVKSSVQSWSEDL